VRNETRDVQFFQDAPEGKPFTYVGIFSFSNGGSEILNIETSFDEIPDNGPKPVHLIYYFEPTRSGLVPFRPPLAGVDGFAQLPSGAALSRTFNTGFFQFSVLLDFDLAAHRIEIMPDQTAFPAFPPPGPRKSGLSAASGEIKLFGAHNISAAEADVHISPGHSVTWWQSPSTGDKPATGQVVTILAAWAPTSLKPADNAPDGVKMVYFDWNNLWLQIQVGDQTGWIRGSSSLRTIGLEMAAAQH
jgi:hypothetical protein